MRREWIADAVDPDARDCRRLFDHPVGADQRRLRDSEAQRLGGLAIDDQLADHAFGRLESMVCPLNT